MADKLSEASWTDYTKKQKLELEDKALVKALAGFDKAPDGKPAAQLAALEEVIEQVKKQVAALVKVKKTLGDKPFGLAKDKLYELLDAAEKLHKETQQAVAAVAKKGASAEDEEEDSPALLTTAMVPLVRQLQKGEMQMHALIAVTSKRVAVLITRRAISPSRRKLMAEYLQMSSGIKYIAAEVAGSAGQVEFLLDSSPGGISKKLRQALFDQTGMRTKVFVQFGEETETDEDDEPAARGPSGRGPDAEEAEDSPETPVDNDASAAFDKALAAIEPSYLLGLRERPNDAGKLRALMDFAQGKAEQGQYPSASAALQKLAELLGGSKTAVGERGSAAPEVPTGTVAAAVLRVELRTLRVNAASGLTQLAATLNGKSDPLARKIEPIVQQLASGMPAELETVLEQLDTAVQLGNAATAQSLRASIQDKVRHWLAYLQTNAHEIRCAENNPWNIAVAIDRPLRAALTAILKTTR